MPRVSQKEIIVNQQIRMQLEGGGGASATDLYVFDPGWGSECVDPCTGKTAKMYDHVPRSMKFSGGTQVWFLVPRYVLEGGGMFRVLPANLSENKHYAVEVIQDEVDDEIESLLEEEKKPKDEKRKAELEGSNDAEERPCSRTKWLWKLWFLKNLLQIESVLRRIQFVAATMAGEAALRFKEILLHANYLGELRTQQPENWLHTVIQAACNSGMPLVPLRECQTIPKVLSWIAVDPISNS